MYALPCHFISNYSFIHFQVNKNNNHKLHKILVSLNVSSMFLVFCVFLEWITKESLILFFWLVNGICFPIRIVIFKLYFSKKKGENNEESDKRKKSVFTKIKI